MRSLKALALMFAVNLLFVITLSATLAIFHVRLHLVGFALLFGFGGAFLSLFLSKWLVKRMFHMVQAHQGDVGVNGQIWQLAAIAEHLKSALSAQENCVSTTIHKRTDQENHYA